MNVTREDLLERLHARELESAELRENLYEFRGKFVQLERAFLINLQCQKRLQADLESSERESKDLRKLNENGMRANVETRTRLEEVTSDRDHWKKVFERQREVIQRTKTDCDDAVDAVKRECEEILKLTRKTTEKHFSELLALYDRAKQEISLLRDQTDQLHTREKILGNRASELANLLETLERFDVSAATLCHATASALKNLVERGDSFEDSLKVVRGLAWRGNREKQESSDELRRQNFALREVVKSLKRRVHAATQNEIAERDKNERNGPWSSTRGDETKFRTEWESREDSATLLCPPSANESKRNENSNSTVCKEDEDCKLILKAERNSHLVHGADIAAGEKPGIKWNKDEKEDHPTMEREEESERHVQENNKPERPQISNSGSETGRGKDTTVRKEVLQIASHQNGRISEEFVIGFSNNREMKVKHCPGASAAEQLKLEFVDENEYEEGRLDGGVILVYLRNVHAIVRVKQSGLNCGTQTSRTRHLSTHTQTQTNRVGAVGRGGVTMLNSEKRAIDRSLQKLERSVADLKSNTVGQARAIISKGPGRVGNEEFFECLKLLVE